MDHFEARNYLLAWLFSERAFYSDVKYRDGDYNRQFLIDAMRDEPFSDGSKWLDFIGNYMKRAQLFGLDTPIGRQALGKTLVTIQHCLETAIMIYGPMPEPGYPSGEIRKWGLTSQQ